MSSTGATESIDAAMHTPQFLEAGRRRRGGAGRPAPPSPRVAAGELLATTVLGASVEVVDGGAHGVAEPVLDGATAELFLVETALGFVAVEGSAVQRIPLTCPDPTRALCRVHLDAAPVTVLDGAADAGELIRDRIALVIAAEQLGGMRRCAESTVEYAGARVQFGLVIGSYQAVKHRCALMHSAAELAAGLVRDAQRTTDDEPAALPLAAAAAASYCNRVHPAVAQDMIAVHGGIGFTWEHDAHLYYKRTRATLYLFGRTSAVEAVLCERLGLTG